MSGPLAGLFEAYWRPEKPSAATSSRCSSTTQAQANPAARTVRQLLRRLPRRCHLRHQPPRLVRMDLRMPGFPDAESRNVQDVSWSSATARQRRSATSSAPRRSSTTRRVRPIYTRANAIVAADGLVSSPYDALKQACYGTQRDRLLLAGTIRHPDHRPGQDTARHLRLPRRGRGSNRDANHVDYDVSEFDERASTPGLRGARPGQG